MTWIDEWLSDRLTSFGDVDGGGGEGGYLLPQPPFGEKVAVSFAKMSAVIPVSLDLLMDEGVIPDTRPKTMRKPPSRRERFRMSRSRWRRSVAEWLYELISGEELPEEEW